MIIRGNEVYKKIEILDEVFIDAINWKAYYYVSHSEKYWVKEHPDSEYHGGGSPILRLLEKLPKEIRIQIEK